MKLKIRYENEYQTITLDAETTEELWVSLSLEGEGLFWNGAYAVYKDISDILDIPVERLYTSPRIEDALGRIVYVVDHQMFAVVTTTPGCGKSTLVRMLNGRLGKERYLLLYLSDSKLTPRWLYAGLLGQLGLEVHFYSRDSKCLLQKEIEDEYQKRYDGLLQRYNAAKARYDEVVATISAKEAQCERLANFIKVLKAQDRTICEFDSSLWGSMVEFITVGRNKEITVTFRDGMEMQA